MRVNPSISGCSILPLRLHVYRYSLGCSFQFGGDGVGPLRYFYLVFVRAVVCVGVCVGVGAARPGPVQLYYSVDLHSKLYMLVFTFCFSNKIPWSTFLFGLLFK